MCDNCILFYVVKIRFGNRIVIDGDIEYLVC